MVEASLNIFDLIVFFVIAVSALIAFLRGLMREVMSLGAWFAASAITVYAFEDVSAAVEPMVGSQTVAGGIAGLGTFITALLAISIINMFLLRCLKPRSEIGIIDNTLGLLFGVARGVLILALGYYVMSIMMCERDFPEWVQTSLTKDFVRSSAAMVAEAAPDYLAELSTCSEDNFDDVEPLSESLPSMELPGSDSAAPDLQSDSDDWMSVDELQNLLEENE